MPTAQMKIPDDVRPILARSIFDGNTLTLPEHLDRDTYLRVAKVLKAARGKWNTKSQTYVFPFDPRELIAGAVETGKVIDAKKALQFFETPDALAAKMVDLAGLAPGEIVLEPSAGLGRLVRPMLAKGVRVVAVELDETNAGQLRQIDGLTVHCERFEDFQAREAATFDAVIMNPPFANGQDMAHIRAAWEFVRPGRRLVAVCSEGPFFRQDKAAVAFRAWLAEIHADANKLPTDTFRESGTGVACRVIFATKAGTPARAPSPDALLSCEHATTPAGLVARDLPMDQVEPDPGQPRKIFEVTALREFAASILAEGLLQPINVREVAPGRFMIVFGERRWRAHQINHAATIRAFVIAAGEPGDIRVKQIVENDQRQDVTQLEQAHSYRALMDECGWTVDQLSARIGKAAWRINERTDLLKLRPEYQALLASGNLKPSEATEMVRLSPRGQDALFNAIRTGGCKTFSDLRTSSLALVDAEAQLSLMPDAPPPPSKEDRELATVFEANVERIAALLRSGIHQNQVVAVRKTNPHRAGTLADLLAVMQKDLRRIEVALREAAIQASFLDVAA